MQRLRPRSEQKRSPGARSDKRDELAISLPSLCRTLDLIAYAPGSTSCVGGAHLDGFAMISYRVGTTDAPKLYPGIRDVSEQRGISKGCGRNYTIRINRCRCQNRRRPWSGQIDTDSIPLRSAKLPNLAARHAESRRLRLPQASRAAGVFLVLILGRSRNCGVCCFRLLDAEFLEALIFGLG